MPLFVFQGMGILVLMAAVRGIAAALLLLGVLNVLLIHLGTAVTWITLGIAVLLGLFGVRIAARWQNLPRSRPPR